LAKGALLEEGLADLRFASREIPKARVQLAQFYEMTGYKDEAMKELRAFFPRRRTRIARRWSGGSRSSPPSRVVTCGLRFC
jgi:hypothetical protein